MDKKNTFKEVQEIIDKLNEINRKLKDHLDKKSKPEEGAKILPFKKPE